MAKFTAVYDRTGERELRAALQRNDEIVLTLPNASDSEEIACTAYVGNYNWLRLTFAGADYTYCFDNTNGWSYRPNVPDTMSLANQVSELSAAVNTIAQTVDSNSMPTIEVGDNGSVTTTLLPNTEYIFTGSLTNLVINLAVPNENEAPWYRFIFNTSGTLLASVQPNLTINSTVTMPDDFALAAYHRYEIDIRHGFASVQSWDIVNG